MKRQGLRLDANYIEDVVAIEIASFLTKVSFPQQRFSIEPMSRARERWLGADARLTDDVAGFMPFYMQFKRPSAYPDTSTSRIIRERAKIEPIRCKHHPAYCSSLSGINDLSTETTSITCCTGWMRDCGAGILVRRLMSVLCFWTDRRTFTTCTPQVSLICFVFIPTMCSSLLR